MSRIRISNGAAITAGLGFIILWIVSLAASLGLPILIIWALLHYLGKC